MTRPKTKDFETTLTELEAVVAELDGDVKLEKALDLFEKGMKLSKDCQTFLKGAEEKVEILKRSMDGAIVGEPFGEEDEDEEEDDDDDDDDDSDDDDQSGSTQLSLGI